MSTCTRRVLLAAGTVTALLGVSACGSGETSSTGEKKEVGPAKGTITWYTLDFGTDNLPQRLVDAFEKAHPDIKVKIKAAPPNTDTIRSSLTTEISGGSTSFDVYSGDVVWPAQFGKAGLALPLSDYLPKSYWESFSPGRTDGSVYEGKHLAAPLYTDEGFLLYRKDLLAKHDLEVPKTWEDLEKAAATIQQAGDTEYGYVAQWANYEGLSCNWTELVASAGGRSLSADGAESAIDSPASRKALGFMRGLVEKKITPKSITTFQEDQSLQTFNQGQSAFLRSWPYAWAEANNPEVSTIAKGDKVGIAPLPGFASGNGQGASTIGGWDLMVNPHTEKLGATLEFLKWMTGEEGQQIMAEGSMIPVNEKVMTQQSKAGENPVLVTAAQNNLVARPSNTPEYSKVSKAIYSNINAALAGSASPDAALKKADAQIADAVGKGSGL